jgi:hypothetical protein
VIGFGDSSETSVEVLGQKLILLEL